MTVPTPVQRPSLPGWPLGDAVAQMAAMTGSPPRPLPVARVLRDGAIAFDAMIDLIGGAARCVRFENFIFAGDATGERFANALAGAARRGVDVRVLYDPVGTLLVRGGSAARMLAGDAGVDARAFRPFSSFLPWSWTRLRHRDHRKLLAVDGGAGIVGGFCISDNWSPSSRGGKGWRDTALQVAGPIVGDLEGALVGSSNLDPLSMRRNYELNLLVADPGTGRAMREMFERDLDNATRVDAVAWSRRPSWQRALEAIASQFRANL